MKFNPETKVKPKVTLHCLKLMFVITCIEALGKNPLYYMTYGLC